MSERYPINAEVPRLWVEHIVKTLRSGPATPPDCTGDVDFLLRNQLQGIHDFLLWMRANQEGVEIRIADYVYDEMVRLDAPISISACLVIARHILFMVNG